MRYIIIISVTFFTVFLHGQIVTLSPQSPGPEDAVTLIFDASIGNKELLNASKVYMHHGVVTDKSDGTTWKYVKGNWGKDDGIGQMSKVPGQTNKWQITFSPNLRSYFGVPSWENIYRIACVFRSPDGSKKGTIAPGEYGWGSVTSNNDIYINLSGSNYVSILSPSGTESTINEGETIDLKAEASAIASEIKLWLDEGNGFTNVTTIAESKFIQYQFKPSSSLQLKIKVTAIINGENLEAIKNHSIIVKRPNIVEPVPIGMKNGINYITGDETKAVLVLLVPEKEFVYVVGDMTDWQIKPEYLMKKSPDGKKFWIELKGLTPKKPYVFQYWIDGNIKVADPFADQIADPWNDKYIESSVFPNLPVYSREDLGIAAVLTTGQTPYQWSSTESAWKRPDANHLVIYELHIRDFIDSHNFKDLTDTLSYLKRLGVIAIELMPVNEFEGNDSWGYNPSFFFAVDKSYGPKEQLKKFIETAHQHGMAVITDLVLNHAFGQCPLVQMYFDKSENKPSQNNPWFNREYVGQYQWGFDVTHQSTDIG